MLQKAGKRANREGRHLDRLVVAAGENFALIKACGPQAGQISGLSVKLSSSGNSR